MSTRWQMQQADERPVPQAPRDATATGEDADLEDELMDGIDDADKRSRLPFRTHRLRWDALRGLGPGSP